MKDLNKSSEKVVRRPISVVVGRTFKISRQPRRQSKDDLPEALWLRLKPYVRLAKQRYEE
jgi:hypothetical protein